MFTRRAFGALVCGSAISAHAQQAAPVPLPQQTSVSQTKSQPVVINFVGEVNYDSVGRLLKAVTDQIARGNHDITILIGSGGGGVEAAFAAFNFLRHLPPPTQITTYNIANADSAAVILFCAGTKRYSLPGAGMRFLVHGTFKTNGQVPSYLTSEILEQQLAQVNSANQMVVQAMEAATNDHRAEILSAVKGQTILTPDQAKDWGLVQAVKDTLFPSNALMLMVAENQSKSEQGMGSNVIQPTGRVEPKDSGPDQPTF
jgi:ATP-dependent protease ClpP protease subunit